MTRPPDADKEWNADVSMNVSLSENENEGVNMSVNGNEDEDANKNMERNADVNMNVTLNLYENENENENSFFFHDGTERPINRPKDTDGQKTYCGGRKKQHTPKDNNAYTLIYEQTAEWLKNDNKNLVDLSGDKDLVCEIVKLDSFQYRALTIEVLAFFNWLRRFAEGLIEGDNE